MPDSRPDSLHPDSRGPDALAAVAALSPVDGRYRAATEPLRELLSEAGLIRERVRIEAAWLLHLVTVVPRLAGAALAPAVIARARELAREPDADCAQSVKAIEAVINHDVKAVEYYVRQQLAAAGSPRRAGACSARWGSARRSSPPSLTARRMCRCWRALTASPPARRPSARKSPTSSPACAAPSAAGAAWRSSASGTAPWAISTRIRRRCRTSTGRR